MERDKFVVTCKKCGSKECTIATEFSLQGEFLRAYLECNECGENSRKAD